MSAGSLYDQAYFGRYHAALRRWEPAAAVEAIRLLVVRSLVDLGCGAGFFVEAALAAGLEARGYELNLAAVLPLVAPAARPHLVVADVSQPIDLDRTFDCALSMEVAEHLSPEGGPGLVENLTRAADRLVVFTAAPPGQGGTGHVNCRPREYWLSLFAARGWSPDSRRTARLGRAWASMPSPGYDPGHIVRNLMVMRRAS